MLSTCSSFATLVNEEPSAIFGSSRGLGQGYPLSPMLFVVAMKGLISLLAYAEAYETMGMQ